MDAPDAFGTTYAIAAALSEGEWRQRAAGTTPLKYFLAFEEATAIGVLAGVSAKGDYELISMWVHPRYRGTGIARDLVAGVVQHGYDTGHSRIVLDVSPNNSQAWRCYAHCGFVFTDHRSSLASRPTIMLQRMELRKGAVPD